MTDSKLVWSDEGGDLRKSKSQQEDINVDESTLLLHLKRKTSGKGRTIVEITNLPANKKWCQKLAKDLKKKLGVGGAYKDNYVEVHGEKMDDVIACLNERQIKWKKNRGLSINRAVL